MSLYGTGRREGIVAALCITAAVLLVHLGAALPALHAIGGTDFALALRRGVLPALGGLLCYRFLRAQGRSRYAGFLCGAAYGLSPWLGALGDAPREQLAAALAPLALEMANRCDRPSQRRVWLPWAWLFLAAPFTAGLTVVGTLAALLCAGAFLRIIACGDQDAELPKLRGLLLAAIGAVAAAANLVWLDPLGPWLGAPTVLDVHAVLTGHRDAGAIPDLAAILRVPGVLLLCFAVLALLRRQRHVDGWLWSGVVVLGSLPTWLQTLPQLLSLAPHWTTVGMLATSAWWLTLLGTAVLAAAGLDDFLDLPQRRRNALPRLLAIAVLAAPLLAAFGADAPAREWPQLMTWPLLALLLPLWRRLGILRFKNLLGVAALLMLALPTLQSQPARSPWAAAPLGEIGERIAPAAPYRLWHWLALGGTLALTAGWSSLAWRDRRRQAIASVLFRGAAVKQKREARAAH